MAWLRRWVDEEGRRRGARDGLLDERLRRLRHAMANLPEDRRLGDRLRAGQIVILLERAVHGEQGLEEEGKRALQDEREGLRGVLGRSLGDQEVGPGKQEEEHRMREGKHSYQVSIWASRQKDQKSRDEGSEYWPVIARCG